MWGCTQFVVYVARISLAVSIIWKGRLADGIASRALSS